MQAAEIASRLAGRAESVCRELLPGGKREGHEWRAGSVSGEAGKSLGVHLSGEKAGVWADFAAGGSGDLLDLWRECRGLDLPTAMREACAFLGVSEPTFASGKAPECRPVQRPQCAKPRDEVAEWLDDRGLSLAAQDAYALASNGTEVVLPYLRDGELVAVKYRDIRDKHRMRVEKGAAMPLFGWQAIPDDAREVTIVEGELDAVACWQMGFPALSVPNGAQGMGWIEVEFGKLERFDTIYVWMDADDQGRVAAAKIVDRLGAHRCRVVRQTEGKDPNDALLARLDAADLMRRAESIDPTELKSAGQFTDEVIRAFHPPDDVEPGIRPPWEKVQGKILLRPAELTIVSGINGHGKSQVTGQMVLDACFQGYRACIASMEMQPRITLQRIVRQAAALRGNSPIPSVPYIRRIQEWLDDKLWLFAVTGTAKADRMLEVFRYAHKRYQIELFVVDSLAKCGLAEDDYNGQKHLVERLKDFTMDTGCHVMLVTHPRKSSSEADTPGKMDVRGAQSITDRADNGFTLWRNKGKEQALQIDPDDDEQRDKPDAMLNWWKSRNGEWEGRVTLWFDRNSHQYLESPRARPRSYVEFTAAPVDESRFTA